ncbi:MAG: trigger factor family protein, partial [Chloroflexi bacterium]|nr:trigger factor family protein [Chloroflexota bacterium]
MQVNVHDAAPGTVELEVQIDQDQFGQTLKDVLDQIARSATLPGFRKGKAPRAMVERSVDRTAVRARAIERVLPSAYKEALEQSGLTPLTDPEVEILSQDED